eukprot:symbB.v1.2.019031.t1/scaffold1543.1/size112713/1
MMANQKGGKTWQRDVVTGHQAMTTTGGGTWDAAFRLADFLEAEWSNLCDQQVPNVLELGAGTGWLGMTLARNVPCSVCLTEQANGGAMAWLQQNLAENVTWRQVAKTGRAAPGILFSLNR